MGGGAVGLLADGSGSLHELHHPRPLEDGAGELAISFDEELGDRHLENLLPAEEIGDPQITVLLLLTTGDRHLDSEPAGDVPQRHPLLLADIRQTVESLLPARRRPRLHGGGGEQRIGFGTDSVRDSAVGDRKGVPHPVLGIIEAILKTGFVVDGRHKWIPPTGPGAGRGCAPGARTFERGYSEPEEWGRRERRSPEPDPALPGGPDWITLAATASRWYRPAVACPGPRGT